MIDFIKSKEEWRNLYLKNRSNIWFIISLYNQEKIYLRGYSEWLSLKSYCELNNTGVEQLKIKYKSHTVTIDAKDYDGVYLVKSIVGNLNSESKETITSGLINNNNVKKTTWAIPELIPQFEDNTKIEDCFEKAIIYDHGKQKK